MARKTDLAKQLSSTRTILTEKTTDLREGFLNLADFLVEDGLKNGEHLQGSFQKALKNGILLFGRQQAFTLDSLEALAEQYGTGKTRLQALLGMPNNQEKTPSRKQGKKAKTDKRQGNKTSNTIDEMMEEAFKSNEETTAPAKG